MAADTSASPAAAPGKLTFPGMLVLIGIVAAGTLIRCHRLGEISYWFDESFCWKMATFEWSELMDRVARDNHPPLYFVLLKLWVSVFGETAVAMRSLSIVCGVFTMFGAFALVRQIQSGATRPPAASGQPSGVSPFVAAGLIALTPVQIDWSQQVRMYSLGAALAIWSSWCLLRVLARPTTARAAAYILTAAALAYTHYYGLFIVAAQFVFALPASLRRRSEPGRPSYVLETMAMFLVVGMVWSFWLPVFLEHRQQVDKSYWTKPFVMQDVVTSGFRMWVAERSEWPMNDWFAWSCVVATLALWLWQLAIGRGGLRLLALGPLMTFGLAIAASTTGRNIFSSRYFVITQGLALCGLALSLNTLPWRWLRGAAYATTLVATGWLCLQYTQRRDELATRPGFQSAVAFLDEVRRPDEPVLVANPMVQINVAAYLRDRGNVYVAGDKSRFPYYQGTAVMRDSEYLSPGEISRLPPEKLWIVDTVGWTAGTHTVALPHPWVDVSEEAFYDWYSPKCQIFVRECLRRRSAAPSVSNGTVVKGYAP